MVLIMVNTFSGVWTSVQSFPILSKFAIFIDCLDKIILILILKSIVNSTLQDANKQVTAILQLPMKSGGKGIGGR